MAQPPPPKRQLPAVTFPPVARQLLDNGLTLSVGSQQNAPLTTVTLAVGASHDRNAAEARLVAHAAIAGGAGRFSATQLAQQLAANGTAIEIESAVDAVSWSITLPPVHLEFAIEALSAVAQHPRWVYAEFTRVRDQQMTRARELAQHDGIWPALRLLHRELYPSPHPYADYDGTADQLGNVTLAGCQRWHRVHSRPDNASLVVAGGHDAQDVAALAEKHFGAWKATDRDLGALPDFPPSHRDSDFEVHVIDRDKAEQTQVVMGWRAPSAGTPEHALAREALRLLCGPRGRFLVTGTERVSRCSVLAYSGGIAVAVVGVTTTTNKTFATVKRLTDAAQQLAAEPVSTATWENNVRDLLGRAPRRWESTRGLAHELTRLAILGVPKDWPEQEARLWQSTDASGVRQIVDSYLLPRRGVLVVTGDADRIGKKLASFGRVTIHAASDLRTTKTLPRSPGR
jgi:zinc protease